MSRIKRSARALTMLAAAALAVGTMFPAFAAPTPTRSGDSGKSTNAVAASKELRPVGSIKTQATSKLRGDTPSIELNVDTTSDDAQLSLISYTFTSGDPVKFAFANRFTLSNDQAPFRLEAVAAFLGTRSDNGEGFQTGEPIGIVVMVDATSSGDMSKAVTVFEGTATVNEMDTFNVYGFNNPIVVQQGDIYIAFVDLTTDAEPTQLPIVLPENGGSTDARAWANLSPSTAEQGAAYTLVPDLLTLDGDPLTGNFAIRGLGDPKLPSDVVTGNGETVDNTIPAPQNLSALGSGTVTLGFTAVSLPPPPPPTQISETSDTGHSTTATAQIIGTNVEVEGQANSNQNGDPGGFGTDDVEDWYCFTITQATSITIDLEDFGGTDFDLLLYNKNGPFTSDDAVAFSGGGAGEEEHITLDIIQPGQYLIAVSAFDPDVPSTTGYTLRVVAAPKVSRYNVFCGLSEDFAANASTFIGSIPGDQTSIIIRESLPGAYYRVSAVAGASQSPASDSATGEPCEGGPTFTSITIKRNGQGAITLKGAQGDLTGIQLQINGVGFTKQPKVKVAKGQVKQKGPLANGQTVGQACPAGAPCTITVRNAAGGCSQITAN